MQRQFIAYFLHNSAASWHSVFLITHARAVRFNLYDDRRLIVPIIIHCDRKIYETHQSGSDPARHQSVVSCTENTRYSYYARYT